MDSWQYTTLHVNVKEDGYHITSFDNMLDTLNIRNYYHSLEDLPPELRDRVLRVMALKPGQTITGVGQRASERYLYITYPVGETQ